MLPRKILDFRSSEIDSDAIWSNQRDKICNFFNSCSLHREWQLAKNNLLTVKTCEVKTYVFNVILVSCAGMTAQYCSYRPPS